MISQVLRCSRRGGVAFDSSALPESDPDYGTAGYLGQFTVAAGDFYGCAVVATNYKTFDVTYDGNTNVGGSAPAVTTSYVQNDNVTVLGNTGASVDPATPFTKTGYTFTGWNTAADGTGTAYAAGDTFSLTATTTLYAQWSMSPISVDTTNTTSGVFAQKTVDTAKHPAKTFDFTLTPGTATCADNTTGTSPAATDLVGTAAYTADETGTKSVDLGKIEFTRAGTYKYTVAETDPGTGWTRSDTDGYEVTVTVTEQADGLHAAVAGISTITNTYTPAPITVDTAAAGSVFATKDVATAQHPAADFDFTITPATGSPAITTAGADKVTYAADQTGAQSVPLGSIEFTEAGVFTYTVAETAPGNGWSPDKSSYDVTVTVTNTEGVLTAAVTGTDTITNSFTYAPITQDPPVSKIISGDTPDTASAFSFTMKAANATDPMPAAGTYTAADGSTSTTVYDAATNSLTATHVGAGGVEFGEISYSVPGTHVYTISETAGTDGAYAYDATVYTITVKVTDDGTGKLVKDVTYAKADGTAVAAAAGMTFTNVYTTPGASDVAVTKSVDKPNAVVGDTLTYTIHVVNNGTRASEGIFVKDVVPDNTTFESCDATGIYSTTSAGVNYVKWWLPNGLQPGESVDLTMTVKVNECQSGTAIDNVALWQETPTKPDSPEAEGNGTGSNKVTTTIGTVVSMTTWLPKTGDAMPYGIAVALMAAAGAALIVARRRRRGL